MIDCNTIIVLEIEFVFHENKIDVKSEQSLVFIFAFAGCDHWAKKLMMLHSISKIFLGMLFYSIDLFIKRNKFHGIKLLIMNNI